MSQWRPSLSLVIPVYNEEANVAECAREVIAAATASADDWEVIFVDDGSVDGTADALRRVREREPRVRVIRHRTNAGQTAAFATGFAAASREVIVTLDGDLQNDPADISKLLEPMPEYDVVCGIRADRKDTAVKRITSQIANGIRNWATGDDIVDTGCSLKAYKREYVQKLKLYTGMHRFLPTLLKLEGCRVAQVPVHHRERKAGQSKYGFHNRLLRPIVDLLAVRWMQKRHFRVVAEELE